MSQTADDFTTKLQDAIYGCCEWDGERWVLLDGCDPADSVFSLLVEQACAGAVVERLTWSAVGSGRIADALTFLAEPAVPIASVGPFGWLAEAVGERLLTQCHGCGHRATCHKGHIKDLAGCEEIDPPPFATVRSELVIGGRPWVEWALVVAECHRCEGTGKIAGGRFGGLLLCPDCKGDGARVNAAAIADRYQPDRPWRNEDTARVARFRVRASG